MGLSMKYDFIKARFDPFIETYTPNDISDEQHTIPASSPFYIRTKEVVKEDSPSTIEIWTGAGKTETKFTEVSSAPGVNEFQIDYKYNSGYVRFNEANANTTIYITYKGIGDIIQAEHINLLSDWIGKNYIRQDDHNHDDVNSKKVACHPVTKIVAANDSIDKFRADYICDGAADDVQINAAIAACTNGGRIVLLEGTYDIQATIDLDIAGITLQGQGWNTILKAKTNLNDELVRFTVDNCILKDLKCDAITNSQSSAAITIEFAAGADNCTMENVFVTNALTAADKTVVSVNDADRTIITRCKLHTTSGTGGNSCLRLHNDSTNCIIRDNIFDASGVTVDCQVIDTPVTSGVTRSIFANNILIGDGVQALNGIYLTDNADNSENVIVGNHIYNMATKSIHIVGGNCSENLIDGNMARNGITDGGTNTVVGDNNVG